MGQKDFNKDIDAYLKERQDEERDLSVEKIKKQAFSQSVEEAHPNLEEGKVQIIEKEPSWIKRMVAKKAAPVAAEDPEFEAEEEEMTAKKGYWQRFKSWVKQEDIAAPTPEEFEEEMEEIKEKEEEIKKSGIEKEEVLEGEKEISEKRSKTIFGFIGRFRRDKKPDVLQEEVFMLEEDLKNIAKITTNVMRKLPPEELQSYKRTTEFEQFKEILRKRNLIKQKAKAELQEEKDPDA